MWIYIFVLLIIIIAVYYFGYYKSTEGVRPRMRRAFGPGHFGYRGHHGGHHGVYGGPAIIYERPEPDFYYPPAYCSACAKDCSSLICEYCPQCW